MEYPYKKSITVNSSALDLNNSTTIEEYMSVNHKDLTLSEEVAAVFLFLYCNISLILSVEPDWTDPVQLLCYGPGKYKTQTLIK